MTTAPIYGDELVVHTTAAAVAEVPFTIIRSMLAAIVLYGVPILAIILVLPSAQITGLGGFILVLLSSGTTWLMGADRSQAVAGYDGAGPRIIGRFSARFGTPIVVNFLSGIVATITMVLAIQLTGSNTEKYFSTVLNVVLLFTTLSYIVIFPALIKLRYSHGHVHRPYRVPFGIAGVWICGILTTFWAAFASLVGLFPGFLVDHKLLNSSGLPEGFSRSGFELTVFVPVVITLGVGVLFYVLGAPTRAESVDLPLAAEPEASGA